jgi:hypothetical protein
MIIRHQVMKNDAYGIERCLPVDDSMLLCSYWAATLAAPVALLCG